MFLADNRIKTSTIPVKNVVGEDAILSCLAVKLMRSIMADIRHGSIILYYPTNNLIT